MKTEITGREGHSVTMRVEVTADEFEQSLDAAYKDLGSKIKVDGFRSGKIPRKVIDSRLGKDAVYEEALRNDLGRYYAQAVIESGIMPVSEPSVSIVESGVDKDLVFEATVEVRPEVEVEEYEGIEVEKEPVEEATDEELDRAMDDIRDRFARLEPAESRSVSEGDFVLVDYKVFADGEPEGGSSRSDVMIEVGKDRFLPGFDKQLVGARRGDMIDVVVSFPPDYSVKELRGKPGTFRTLVKEVKRKVLPDLDDDFAKEVSEFETMDELREDLRGKITEQKSQIVEQRLRERVLEKLIEMNPVDLPRNMVEGQVQQEVAAFARGLSERNIGLDEYLAAAKTTRTALEESVRDRVVRDIKADLILDAVAEARGIEVSDEEVEEAVSRRAELLGHDEEELIGELRKTGRIEAIRANMRLGKALDFVADNAIVKGGQEEEEGGGVSQGGEEEGEPVEEQGETAGDEEEEPGSVPEEAEHEDG